MKNHKKTLLLLSLSLLLLCSACTKESKSLLEAPPIESSESIVAENTTKDALDILEEKHPKIEDIDWHFINGIHYDVPAALFGYTNNSDFTILLLDLEFKFRDDVTAEQLSILSSAMEEDVSEIEILEWTLNVRNHMTCDPEESVEGSDCYFDYIHLATNSAQCELTELSFAEIEYIGKDEKRHTLRYSAENNGYTISDLTEELFTWSDSEQAQSIPQPNTRILTVDYEEDDFYQFTAYDITADQYKDYTEDCKNYGFSIDIEDNLYSFYATNADGLRLHVQYYPYMHAITVEVRGTISSTSASVNNTSAEAFDTANIITSDITGTYKADSIEVSGVRYTVSELEAMGDDSLSSSMLVIKDGGKAYVSDSTGGILVDWSETENGIKIGVQDSTFNNGYICFAREKGNLYFVKVSDSQEITPND